MEVSLKAEVVWYSEEVNEYEIKYKTVDVHV